MDQRQQPPYVIRWALPCFLAMGQYKQVRVEITQISARDSEADMRSSIGADDAAS